MANTITLTNGNDSETGTILDDIIWSLDGDDTVSGGIGSDTIHGGNGSDELWGDRAMTRSMAIMITTISTVAMETTR
jgi:Ca2+-binding RTX toxin-like protein